MKYNLLILFLLSFLVTFPLTPVPVYAHPGRTDSSGGHTCRTNCESWGLGDGEYQIWGERIRVEHGRTQNDRGSIAGSVITMLDAVRMMLSLNFSEVEVARMASLNPARLLGVAGDCGSIEAGKRADLAALDQDGNVRLTIIGGRTASQSAD